jgi:hypothetical protein
MLEVLAVREEAEKALARSAHCPRAYFEQALNALPHLSERHDTLKQAIDLPAWITGSNATETYGKAHCQGETFPTTCLFAKICARNNRHIKDLYRIAPGQPHIFFGKVPDNITVSI